MSKILGQDVTVRADSNVNADHSSLVILLLRLRGGGGGGVACVISVQFLPYSLFLWTAYGTGASVKYK